jgi:hypothetical protein
MTKIDTTVLNLLGKQVSFSLQLCDQKKLYFPNGIHVTGVVEEVIIALSGNHQILVGDEFYELKNIKDLV